MGGMLEQAFTFAFFLMKAGCFCFFLDKTGPRRWRAAGSLACVLAFATAIFCLTESHLFDMLQWQYLALRVLACALFALAYGKLSVREACFYAIVIELATGFVTHLASHLSIMEFSLNYLVEGTDWAVRALFLAGTGIAYLTVLGLARTLLLSGKPLDVTWGQVGLALLAAVPAIYLTDLVTHAIRDSNAAWARGFQPIVIEFICSFCGLALIVVSERISELKSAQQELALSKRIIDLQHQQYLVKRESIDEVNRKYHDLRKHLAAIRQSRSPETQSAYLDSLERELASVGPVIQTGCEMLDIVVADKMALCERDGIGFSIMADGGALSFVDPMDITTVFGNALDNAIEAARAVAGPKEVRVRVEEAIPPMVLVRIENTSEEVPDSRNGNLRSSKPGDGHGWGLRNIRKATEKYRGTVSTAYADGRFTLTVLLSRE